MAGTKGSHIVTFHAGLRQTIGDAALYVEADDGRPVFVLPFGSGTLIGTTDLPYEGDPSAAVASEAEIDYLLNLVNEVLPRVKLSRGDVTLHYAGVRPLPRSDASTPAAITRRHAVVERSDLPWPVFSLVGGKLTTCRQLAEDAVRMIASRLGIEAKPISQDRPIRDLRVTTPDDDVRRPHVDEVSLLRRHARQVVRQEFVRKLDDLVERRLMLHFLPELKRATLDDLAGLFVEEGLLDAARRDDEVHRVVERLRDHFGRTVSDG
jgi:glycerol-3-phosphate dehydrogenase